MQVVCYNKRNISKKEKPYGNDGWFEMDCSYYDFGNVTYHNQKGGVMVPK